MNGDGTQSLDFTYIANVMEADILAATKKIETPIVMNCATHGQVTINELVEQINKHLLKKKKPIYKKKRPGDILHSYANIDLIKQELNYEPKINFSNGLQNTILSMNSKRN